MAGIARLLVASRNSGSRPETGKPQFPKLWVAGSSPAGDANDAKGLRNGPGRFANPRTLRGPHADPAGGISPRPRHRLPPPRGQRISLRPRVRRAAAGPHHTRREKIPSGGRRCAETVGRLKHAEGTNPASAPAAAHGRTRHPRPLPPAALGI